MNDENSLLPMVEDFVGKGIEKSKKNAFVPAINMYEKGDDLVIETPLLGVHIDDVDISLENNILILQGTSYKEHEIDEKNYYRKEIRSGSFYRQIALPVPVMEEKIEAKYDGSMLKIICPKAEKKEVKKIEIQRDV
ncbi:Hsp20/alpha crystallin family protein [Patescibacteria group bacterium]|nr:Hsp20/alpha crystallin family protein [Patescibacteria group bacterium]MBU1721475.1 Hsp20/alpha crystallin family protein [Patescibacteria group bacterium]MBU1900768.1 Hsp20/alpha crystallin family protein [Patescibacteria group bacterium]